MNPLRVTHRYSKDLFGDHVPITLVLSLSEWGNALRPDKFFKPTITKTRIPTKGTPEYIKLINHIANLHSDVLNMDIVNILAENVLFNTEDDVGHE